MLLPLVGAMMTWDTPSRFTQHSRLLPLVGAMMTVVAEVLVHVGQQVAAPRRGDDDCEFLETGWDSLVLLPLIGAMMTPPPAARNDSAKKLLPLVGAMMTGGQEAMTFMDYMLLPLVGAMMTQR